MSVPGAQPCGPGGLPDTGTVPTGRPCTATPCIGMPRLPAADITSPTATAGATVTAAIGAITAATGITVPGPTTGTRDTT